jgi:hypothetical protein
MDRVEFEVHERNIDALWAEEVLRDRGGSLKATELKSLVLVSTGDQDEADTAFANRLLEEMRNDPTKTPDV